MSRGWSALLVLSAAALGCEPDSPRLCAEPLELASPRLSVDGHALRDSAGRWVLLRGVNAGGRSKLPPFFPFPFVESGEPSQANAPPFDEALAVYVDRVAGWGHNVVRLPFSWEAVEPVRGEYDAVFVERYAAMVEAFGARGIRVLVDFHQDVFARSYCGDGFPLWAASEPSRPAPESCRNWFLGYYSDPAVRGDFDRLWADGSGLRAAFIEMWQHMAARLWPMEHVIGFEIINEPGWGTADPDAFSQDVLPAFYAEVAERIREVAPDAPVYIDILGRDALAATTALNRPAISSGLVFAPHFYASSVILAGEFDGAADIFAALGNWATVGVVWGVPVLLGEFGIPAEAESAASYLEAHYAALDAYAMHGTAWEYSATIDDWNAEGMSLVDGDGRETPGAAAVVRAYPAALAGVLGMFSFDPATRRGELAFVAEAGGLSEVRAPQRLYPGGVALTVDGPACATYHAERGLLAIRAEAGGEVRVSFEPAD